MNVTTRKRPTLKKNRRVRCHLDSTDNAHLSNVERQWWNILPLISRVGITQCFQQALTRLVIRLVYRFTLSLSVGISLCAFLRTPKSSLKTSLPRRHTAFLSFWHSTFDQSANLMRNSTMPSPILHLVAHRRLMFWWLSMSRCLASPSWVRTETMKAISTSS